MKPTGATKEATGHSPLPWRVIIDDTGDPETGGYPAIVGPERFDEMIVHWKGFHHQYWDHHPNRPTQVANAQLIVTAVNEREQLREALRQARQCITGHVCIINWSTKTRELQTRETQRIVELIDAVLNDATSAGEGERG